MDLRIYKPEDYIRKIQRMRTCYISGKSSTIQPSQYDGYSYLDSGSISEPWNALVAKNTAWCNSNLLSSSHYDTITIWDVETGKPIRKLTEHNDTKRTIYSIPASTGRQLCSYKKIWDLRSETSVRCFQDFRLSPSENSIQKQEFIFVNYGGSNGNFSPCGNYLVADDFVANEFRNILNFDNTHYQMMVKQYGSHAIENFFLPAEFFREKWIFSGSNDYSIHDRLQEMQYINKIKRDQSLYCNVQEDDVFIDSSSEVNRLSIFAGIRSLLVFF